MLCWGDNSLGQLGDGTTMDRSRPTSVPLMEDPVQLGAGGDRTCILLASGAVWCWGEGREPQPTSVEDARAIALGGFGRTCFIRDTGTAACLERSSFIEQVDAEGTEGSIDIAAGDQHSCVIVDRGAAGLPSVRCWGANRLGQLGDGTTFTRTTTVDAVGSEGARQVTAGRSHSCFLRDDGQVLCWGRNREGQLGDGTTVGRTVPTEVVGLRDVAFVAAGHVHTCARARDGRVSCWGRNQDGQLGDGTLVDRRRPVPVPIPDALELGSGLWHSCARRASDRVYCWGSNADGQLGDGTLDDTLDPVQVLDLP